MFSTEFNAQLKPQINCRARFLMLWRTCSFDHFLCRIHRLPAAHTDLMNFRFALILSNLSKVGHYSGKQYT